MTINTETYVIKEDAAGGIVVYLDQVVINTIAGGIQTTFVDLIPQRTLTHMDRAVFFSCDNGTEHGFYFIDTDQYVAPHVSGVRLPMYRATTQAHVQARNDSLAWIVPPSGEQATITFYDADPSGLGPGVSSPAILAAQIVSNAGWVNNQTEDAAGSPASVASAIQATAGYDAVTADGHFVPNRTPNVWAIPSAAPNATTYLLPIYTAPSGLFWRLQFIAWMGDGFSQNSAIGIWENGQPRLSQLWNEQAVAGNRTGRMLQLPGNGLKATATGSTLQLRLDSATNITAVFVNAGIYVGP